MCLNYGKVDYKVIVTPEAYVCTSCGAKHVKLWRQYQTFLNHIDLLCAECAAKNQTIDISTMDEHGLYLRDDSKHLTDQIGWLVPAVPTEEGDTFWGYSSVPLDGCTWWKSLPLKEQL